MKKFYVVSIFIILNMLVISCKDKVAIEELNDVTDTLKVQNNNVKLIENKKVDFEKPYNVTEDAQLKIDELIDKAKLSNKNIFIQAGGNWCIWCLRFNDFIQNTSELKKIVDENYEYYHLNYSRENKNETVFAKYAPNAKDFGYPFFIILNQNGEVKNIIKSGDLESGKSYDKEKVKQMFLANIKK